MVKLWDSPRAPLTVISMNIFYKHKFKKSRYMYIYFCFQTAKTKKTKVDASQKSISSFFQPKTK